MTHYWPEKYQLGIVSDFLTKRGIQHKTEFLVDYAPIDVVGYDSGETYAIELKTKNIKKGIRQALRNRTFVEYSYLAIWAENITEETFQKCSNKPIGLLSIGSEVEVLTEPQKANPANTFNRKIEQNFT